MNLAQCLNEIAGMYGEHRPETDYGFALQHGRAFDSPGVARPEGWVQMERNQCFRNSFDVAQENDGYTYVEGFAFSRSLPIPFAHAWVLDREGRVIELTWDDPGREYFGIPFRTGFVTNIVWQSGYYGMLGVNLRRLLSSKPENFLSEQWAVVPGVDCGLCLNP